MLLNRLRLKEYSIGMSQQHGQHSLPLQYYLLVQRYGCSNVALLDGNSMSLGLRLDWRVV
jgi:hypothetical protein